MKKINLIIISIIFLITYVLVYRAFFTDNPLVWGDAPYFYEENLKELFNKPLLWNDRNDNFGNSQASVLWLYIPTFLFGLLNHYFNLSSEILIRIIFYFPATLSAIIGSFIFLRRFTKNIWAQAAGSFLYSFNTYFLMEIDGGPVGLALAYGLFPLVIWSVFKYLESFSIKTFVLALLFTFLITNIDLRAALISFFFVLLWGLGQKGKLGKLGGLGILVSLLNSFWLIPFIQGSLANNISLASSAGSSTPIKLIDSLFLFNPHFPLNDFGNLANVPFYFGLLPLLFFSGLILLKPGKEYINKYSGWLLMFLFFVFMSKGASEPLGGFYNFLVLKIPFGIAFRDSSKFFIPLFLSASVLLVLFLNNIPQIFKKQRYSYLIYGLIFIYLAISIYPALLGRLTGVLSQNSQTTDFKLVSNILKQENSFSRSLWFDEKPPLAFGAWNYPALSANNLYKERPFASMIDGKYDLYQFLQNPQLPQWLDLLGIKYLFFPENERKKTWSEEEKQDRNLFLLSLDKIPGLKKLNWPISYSGYQTSEIKPHIFAQKELLIIVGGEDAYQDLMANPKFKIANQGVIFLEDGKIDSKLLDNIEPRSFKLILADNSFLDLSMVFLKNKMVSPLLAKFSDWGKAKSEDYLNWKYEFLKGGVRTYDFDFGKGVAYSSIKNEKLKFDLDVPKQGDYYLGVRYLTATNSSGLKVSWQKKEEVLKTENNRFNWQIFGPVNLTTGSSLVTLENMGGFVGLNTITLITEKEWLDAQTKAGELMEKSSIYQISKTSDWQFIPISSDFISVDYKQINPTEYKVNLPKGKMWLVFSDHYNPGWTIDSGSRPLPLYSMINGFWITEDSKSQLLLKFKPQEAIDQSLKISLIFFCLLVLVILALAGKKWYSGKRT